MSDQAKSSVYFAAANAMEAALPPGSKALIERRDELHRTWAKAGYGDVPVELLEAGKAVDADELAHFAMECRRRGNAAFHQEWKRDEQAKAL